MSTIKEMLLFTLLLSISSCHCFENKKVVYVNESAKLGSRPRLLMSADDEIRIKNTISTDSVWSAMHQIAIDEAEEMLDTEPVAYELEGIRLLEKSRACRRRVIYLAYAWRMTHDKKYLNRVEKELNAVSAFKDWNPQHFLDVAEMTMAVAIGYDWLQNDLPKSTLVAMQEAIIKKGLEPSFEPAKNEWWKSIGNWNQVCNAGLAYGAIAVFDSNPELARKVLNRAIESIKLPMKEYDPDGTYEEGYEYWRYGTTFNVYLIDALEKVLKSDFGLLHNSGFLKTPEYLLHMVGPTMMNFNFGDSESNTWLNPAMFWFANKTSDLSLLYSEKLIAESKRRVAEIKDLPVAILWGSNIRFSEISKPSKLIWSGDGKSPVALLRSSWGKDGIFIGIKGGSATNSHAHMDAGSFVFDALGERWVIDLGSQSYNSLESKGLKIWSYKQESARWQVFRFSNLSHNTLVFNNEIQNADGFARITKTDSTKNFLRAVVDLSDIYSKHVHKAFRGVAIANQKYAIVRDEFELKEEAAKIRWAFVTPANVTLVNDTTAELLLNGKKMRLIIQTSVAVKLVTWSTSPQNDYDEDNPGTLLVGFEIAAPASGHIELTVAFVPETVKGEFGTMPSLKNW